MSGEALNEKISRRKFLIRNVTYAEGILGAIALLLVNADVNLVKPKRQSHLDEQLEVLSQRLNDVKKPEALTQPQERLKELSQINNGLSSIISEHEQVINDYRRDKVVAILAAIATTPASLQFVQSVREQFRNDN